MHGDTRSRHQGKIDVWKDEQGYGFIMPNGRGAKVFVHIQSFRTRGMRPSVNDVVTYELGRNDQGQARAERVVFVRVPTPSRASNGKGGHALAIAAVFLLLVAVCVLAGKMPGFILGLYAGMSLLTFIVYARDKSAAQDNRWRTPEDTLHLLALAGGWPGALVAQARLRHKSKKPSFRLRFWLTVGANCVALLWLCSSSGAHALRSVLGSL